ncbi:polysaccharide pyruvyl transferase family protein [Bacteroides sp.]|uniref:polysaccharide pyruvyl transferase family protein n=1 Tax=Bacteroides sp. TaxID=29523 RepID=UPI00262EC843|nr:polysaccharide pyruvyl transferase family protein [Bacteroides sp.]
MENIGIITIHRIFNYGSVFQAYALQKVCEDLGYRTEIIDYRYPNVQHQNNKFATIGDFQSNEPIWIKYLFVKALLRQHRGINNFVYRYQHLSPMTYNSPEELKKNPPQYDVYITGSDQLWNPRHCNGDPAFLLHFAPEDAMKISYAASVGVGSIPLELHTLYKELLDRYKHISVRESSGINVIHDITGMEVNAVLDPTLLLNKDEWNKIATPKRLIKKKYILCYYLNYTFDAFPYVDNLTDHMQKQTGYEIVHVARPPHKLVYCHTKYRVGASPEEFLALVRDAEMILTTSFHGTAFALNYGKPLLTVVQDKNASDSRQVSLMHKLNLDTQILSVKDAFPDKSLLFYNVDEEQIRLEILRKESKQFLINALRDE